MKLLMYGLFLVFTMSGLEKCHDEGGDHDFTKIKLGEIFEIELDKSGVIKSEKLGISYISHKESRCPQGTNCMRAGEAKGTFKLKNESGEKEIILEAKGLCEKVDGSCGQSKSSMGYTIKLISLNPYPGTADAKAKKPMKAKLQITKN